MSSHRYCNPSHLLAAMIGASLSAAACFILMGDTAPSENAVLDKKSPTLEQTHKMSSEFSVQKPNQAADDIEQLRKDLSTVFIGDARSLGEKLHDFLEENSHPQTIAIACKVVADLAENSDILSNTDLNSLYHKQRHPELKRVLAQVLSSRGNNQLMDQLIADSKPALLSGDPELHRSTLNYLAKTHYKGAADVVVVTLQNNDLTVILDALLAMRATGNEGHISAVEHLLTHSDQSISWLAADVIKNLQNLSTKARTTVTAADIAAELPPIVNM